MPESPGQFLPASRRAVITGAGIISPMGCGWAENAAGIRSGRLAFREITAFDASRQRTSRAGEVELPATTPTGRLDARAAARLAGDRASRLLLHAATEAVAAAGWSDDELAGRRLPLVLGTSAGSMAFGEAFFRAAGRGGGDPHRPPRRRCGQATRVRHYQTQHQATRLAGALGTTGPITIVTNACASGANAIGTAQRLVRSGRAERVLAGGYDALCELVFAGFDSLQALSTGVPRPFDRHRDGLALGEGAAVVAVESLESARARGARILGEIAGYGAATDTHHLTQPSPDGATAVTTMAAACREAGVRPAEVGYLNAHGTGTPRNDASEGLAVATWAGHDAGKVAVSSTKSMIGHLLGAAGAVESVICLMVIEEGWLPPSTSVRDPDPVCTFDLVTEPREATVRVALSNSFGFGGANASLVFRSLASRHD